MNTSISKIIAPLRGECNILLTAFKRSNPDLSEAQDPGDPFFGGRIEILILFVGLLVRFLFVLFLFVGENSGFGRAEDLRKDTAQNFRYLGRFA